MQSQSNIEVSAGPSRRSPSPLRNAPLARYAVSGNLESPGRDGSPKGHLVEGRHSGYISKSSSRQSIAFQINEEEEENGHLPRSAPDILDWMPRTPRKSLQSRMSDATPRSAKSELAASISQESFAANVPRIHSYPRNPSSVGSMLSHSLTSLHRRPLRILCLDGGGIRGLSSLLMLKKIMDRIADAEAEEEGFVMSDKMVDFKGDVNNVEGKGGRGLERKNVAKPCDYFDLIGGTSTGGLIAIMLGRLRMTVDECIKAYIDLASDVFSQDLSIFGIPYSSSRFSGQRLEAAIKKVVCQAQDQPDAAQVDEDLKLNDERVNACKTFVLAAYSGSTGGAVKVFRSYSTAKERSDQCAIWQAGRATAAAPTFFPSISFATQLNGPSMTYVDAGLGHNNGSEMAIIEAEDAFPGVPLGFLLSLGCGRKLDPSMTPGSFSFLPFATNLRVALACVDIATSTDQVDQRVSRHPAFNHGTAKYIRLNVDRSMEHVGLEEWKQFDQVATATDIYLNAYSTGLLLDEAVHSLRRLTYRAHPIFIPPQAILQLDLSEPKSPKPGKPIFSLNEISNQGDEQKDVGKLKNELACKRMHDINLRFLARGPHGRYRITYWLKNGQKQAISDPAKASHQAEHDQLLPPINLTFTAGKPFDARTFATRHVSHMVYSDVAAQLIAPPFDRRIISAEKWNSMIGLGYVPVRGEEISIGIDGYIAICMTTAPSTKGIVPLSGNFGFGGIQLDPAE